MPKKTKPTTIQTVDLKELFERYPEELFLKCDGYDDCCVGILERFGQETPILLYSKDLILNKLATDMAKEIKEGTKQERWDAAMESALEYWEFNIIGAWMGPKTPGFVA